MPTVIASLACGGGDPLADIYDEMPTGCIPYLGIAPGGETSVLCERSSDLAAAAAVIMAHCDHLYDGNGNVSLNDVANNTGWNVELASCTSRCEWGCF